MKLTTLGCALSLSLIPLVAFAEVQRKPVAAADSCAPATLDIEGNQIWVNTEGSGKLTVVFESGFGNDSGVWSKITPRIRAAGVRTFVYDRAGMGKSAINTAAPYSLDNDVNILRTALASCGIAGPIVMVGHSYGGAIILSMASEDERVKGLVFVDALVPKGLPKNEVEENLKLMRASYLEVLQKEPGLAKVAIPWAEALPMTAKRLDGLRISDTLPIIDIVAENGKNTPISTQQWREAHREFTANNPHREPVFAAGSSHKVMADKPDLVVAAILKMIEKTKSRSSNSMAAT